MNLASPATVRTLLAGLDMHPSKALGQNFLIDRNIVDGIVEASGVTAGERVLEIGPGLGILTEALLNRGAHVTAIEKDSRLYGHLQTSFGSHEHLTLVLGDAVSTPTADMLRPAPDRVISNLPYSVGTRILVALALAETPPPFFALTLQDEVGDRMSAKPGSKSYGLLSIILQIQYHVHRVRAIKPTCFWPQPDVTSALMTLTQRAQIPQAERTGLCHMLKAVFARRRKQLHSTLDHILEDSPTENPPSGVWLLASLALAPEVRPEAVAPFDWLALFRLMQPHLAMSHDEADVAD